MSIVFPHRSVRHLTITSDTCAPEETTSKTFQSPGSFKRPIEGSMLRQLEAELAPAEAKVFKWTGKKQSLEQQMADMKARW